jgi:transposase-like protein
MQSTIKKCPQCSHRGFVKHGIIKQKQRYWCKSCGYKFTVNKVGKAIDQFYVVRSLQLYLEGLGFRSIERILGISHVTVMNWVKKYGKGLSYLRAEGNTSKIVEVDELCSYVGQKKTTYGSGLLLTEMGRKCWVLLSEIDQKQQATSSTNS